MKGYMSFGRIPFGRQTIGRHIVKRDGTNRQNKVNIVGQISVDQLVFDEMTQNNFKVILGSRKFWNNFYLFNDIALMEQRIFTLYKNKLKEDSSGKVNRALL